ncbi:hypothetical protein F503_07753 [Ophiostoma piceae UAMH 11346]|uniref:DUF6594 domain-containing protein n=1 Tax=Ophiostoma piceae (strain UAMH 11346) TaxID=1262450 RepID=S3C2V0_OPHP1|nr:hypothetical protein F503_07753 [Ophiostoma piceae UAMH 11346]
MSNGGLLAGGETPEEGIGEPGDQGDGALRGNQAGHNIEEGRQYITTILEGPAYKEYGKRQYADLLGGPKMFRQSKYENEDDSPNAATTTSAAESGLSQWLAKVHRKGLIQFFGRKCPAEGHQYADHEANVGFVMSLAELQRMRMRKLQAHLIYDVTELRFHGEAPGWETHLDDYVKSLQDYEYMVKTQKDDDDPFLVTSERLLDRILLRKAMERFDASSIQKTPVPRPERTAPETRAVTPVTEGPGSENREAAPVIIEEETRVRGGRPLEREAAPVARGQARVLMPLQNSLAEIEVNVKRYLEKETKGREELPFYYKPDPICKPRDQLLEDFYTARVLFAVVGSLFLLAPMWIMVLHNTLWTGLATTTAFVSVFAFLAAWRLTTTNEVIGATAAYTAVLVVFVGVSTT